MRLEHTHWFFSREKVWLSCTLAGAAGRPLWGLSVTFRDQLSWSQSNLKPACLQRRVVPLQCRSCHDNLFCKHLSYPIKCLTVTAREGFPQHQKKKEKKLSVISFASSFCLRSLWNQAVDHAPPRHSRASRSVFLLFHAGPQTLLRSRLKLCFMWRQRGPAHTRLRSQQWRLRLARSFLLRLLFRIVASMD